jgi:hypothetical protein
MPPPDRIRILQFRYRPSELVLPFRVDYNGIIAAERCSPAAPAAGTVVS